jgi:phytoene desaturase
MKEAQSNYNIAIKDLVYRPGISPLELVTIETAKKVGEVLAETCAKVQEQQLIQILEFPVLFLEQTIRYAFIL